MEKNIPTAENIKIDKVFSPDLAVRYESKERPYNLDSTYDVGPQRRRHIHRVPPQLRRRNEKRREYDPTIVSLGPFHHGRPELRAAEEVKHRFLHRLASGSDAKKALLHDMVLEKIGEIRACYADDCVSKIDDEELAAMMLLDACFIAALMEGLAGDRDVFLIWHQCLGVATLQFAFPDMMLLENQLPFYVLKLVVSLRQGKEGDGLINKYLNWFLSGEFMPHISPVADGGSEQLPLHLLEACHRMLVADESGFQRKKSNEYKINGFKFTNLDHDITARSAMDLKANGIEVRPNSSRSIREIKFKSGSFSAELQLPMQMVCSNTLSALSNMIAYEMSAGAESEFEVLSYANFMKSLIGSVEDVKELQEKGILINRYQNHQQLVEELRGVDTFGLDNFDIFKDVKLEIEGHCQSKAKTWMADLIHTRFASPWTVIALLAATILLCLTFTQTYFTINPVN